MQPLMADTARSFSDSIDVYERARVAVQQATERTGTPHRALTTRLAVLMGQLLSTELTEGEMSLIPLAIQSAIDDRFHPISTDDAARAALLAESEADRAEDAITDLRMIDPQSVVHVEMHARALDRQSIASRIAARYLWGRARTLGRTREIARARLGLTGAAS